MDLARGVGPGDTPALGSPLVIILLVAVLALVGALVWLVLRSRRHDAEALRDRDATVAAAVEAELGRRQRDLDDRAEKVRADAAAEAERTRALAEQALASAEQARSEAADDVRRAEERRTQVEADVAAARSELDRPARGGPAP